VRDGVVVRQWTTVAQWALVATAAYAAALVVNTSVAYWLDTGPDPAFKSTSRSENRSATAANAHAQDTSVILQRNLFGDQPIPVAAVSPDAGGMAEAQPPTDLRLLGTAQVDDRGYAVIEDVAGSRQEVFVVGEVVFEGPTLIAVRPGQAIVDWNGRKQTLEISEPTPERGGVRGERRKLGEKSSGDGIRQTGAGAFLVDRREVEHSIENLNQIATQMRAVPYLKDGQTLGFRVFNIRSDSIFERMGLKNGDVIQRVNGVELDSPAKALALLEDVQTTDEIRVDLLRDNAPSTMTYTVR
jgi:type II secretion system protein C